VLASLSACGLFASASTTARKASPSATGSFPVMVRHPSPSSRSRRNWVLRASRSCASNCAASVASAISGAITSSKYPASVLGWKLAAATPGGPEPGRVTLEVHSSLITARKVVEVERSRVTVTTFVRYERRLGRRIWSALAPVHHLTEPLLLTLAASRRNAGS